MSAQNGRLIEENEHYSLTQYGGEKTLLFSWKPIAGLSIQDMQKGITEFAGQCKTHKPTRAIIDARNLDPNSPALAWVSSQKTFPDVEEYVPWWTREIVPLYHDAGISGLAVATGVPNSPGEVASVPPGVKFKMGYFADLEAAMGWKPD